MDSSKKSNTTKTAKVNPGETTVLQPITVEIRNPNYWKSEFGNFEEIKNQNALCQLFKDPAKVEKLTLKDIEDLHLSDIKSYAKIFEEECILHRACFAPSEVFEYLIKKGLHPKILDKYKQTPLHLAAYKNKPDIIKCLMRKNYDGNELTDDKHTAVHYAAFSDATDALEVLNNYGCNMNEGDRKGRTPLTLALNFEKRAAMKFLLDLDLEINYITMLKLLDSFPKLAASVLYKKPFCTIDDDKGEVKYDFSILLPRDEYDKSDYLPTPMAIVVKNKSLCVVESNTFQEYIKTQWEEFGRKFAFTQVFIRLTFVLVWTFLGVLTDYNTRGTYNFPADTWRIILLIIAVIGLITEISLEWREYQSMMNQTKLMDIFWFYELSKTDDRFFKEDPKKRKKDEEQLSYFNQRWNLLDLASIVMQIVDLVCQIILVFSNIGRAHNYVVCTNITLLWIGLLQTLRPFGPTGTLVVSLSKVVGKDLCRFSIIFLMFLLPMSFNFWMTFSGKKVVTNNITTTVDYFDDFTNVIFSVFRIAVVDEYDYNNMKIIEPLFTEILITLWISIAAILLVNLFIALLSDTFQRVYDNTNLTITLEKARYLVAAWDIMQKGECILKYLKLSQKNILEKMKGSYCTQVCSLEFIKPTKLHNILKNIQEYLTVHDKILEDTFHMKHVIKKILKSQKIAHTPDRDAHLHSQKSVPARSVLKQNITMIKKDLQKLLQHFKDSRSEKPQPSTSSTAKCKRRITRYPRGKTNQRSPRGKTTVYKMPWRH